MMRCFLATQISGDCTVMTFNDLDRQTKDEVVHQFHLAAKVASGE